MRSRSDGGRSLSFGALLRAWIEHPEARFALRVEIEARAVEASPYDQIMWDLILEAYPARKD